jgi:chromosome segregation ATPase
MVSGDAAHVASRDALRADLAETKLLVHDLTKQLQEANARIAAGAGAKSYYEAVTKAMDTQRAQRDTIDRLTKEVNGLLQKNRLIEAHVDALTDQERELRRTFDAFVFWIVLGVLGLAVLVAAELFGFVDGAGALVARRVKRWSVSEL